MVTVRVNNKVSTSKPTRIQAQVSIGDRQVATFGQPFRKRLAQIQGQFVVYILTLLIVAGTFIFGYSAIKNIVSGAEAIQYADLKNKMTATIERLTSFNEVAEGRFRVPGGYDEVCFADPVKSKDSVTQDRGNKELDPIILDAMDPVAVTETVNTQVFLRRSGMTRVAFSIGKAGSIQPVKHDIVNDKEEPLNQLFFCTPISSGHVLIKFRSKGKYVEVFTYCDLSDQNQKRCLVAKTT